jgi:tetratricopeptide (TPR) repeat protein
LALVLLAGTVLAGVAYAQLTPAQKALEEQGRYWEDRHQPERALAAWQKLLESDAGNTEALLHLGLIAARAGHLDQARGFADKLKTAHPDAPENAVLGHAIAVGSVNDDTLAEARRLADAGQYDAAMAYYRRALKNQPPPPDLAQEYYETLAGSKGGWEEARHGLQQLSVALPNDLSVQYGYARVLTYRESTRRQGIAMLTKMAGDASVGRQANQAWHDALLWLSVTPADKPLYTAYLAAHPNDAAVAKKMATIQTPAQAAHAAAEEPHHKALAALDAGRLKEAGSMFEALIKANPKDADAYGGLGVVREREGRLAEARDLLNRAVSMEPQGDTRWHDALNSAVYLQLVDQAKAAAKAKNWKEAEEKAQEALKHPMPGDSNAQQVLAEAMRHMPHPRTAEAQPPRHEAKPPREAKAKPPAPPAPPHHPAPAPHLAKAPPAPAHPRAMAENKPKHERHAEMPKHERHAEMPKHERRAEMPRHEAEKAPPAVRHGRHAEAAMAPPMPRPMSDLARRQAAALADQARAEVDHGDFKSAVDAYHQAMARDPANPWYKLDYARLMMRMGDRAGADATINGMVAVPHASGDTLAAAAIWYGEHGDYARAATLAQQVPPDTRVADFAAMSMQWRASEAAKRAVALARAGRRVEAHRVLDQIVATSGGNIGAIGVAADAYVDIGDGARAVAVLRAAIGPNPSLDGLIQYAGVMLRVGDTADLTRVMHVIDARAAELRPAQQAEVADLHRGMAIKLADQARLRGDYAGAYECLAPELRVSHDPTVLAALARIYDSAGRHDEAIEIYTRILQSPPSNMDARREMVGAAIALGRYHQAHVLLNEALAASPEDPRLHLLAARLARVEGDSDRALAELGKAQAELLSRGQIATATERNYPPESGLGPNPFATDKRLAEHTYSPPPRRPLAYDNEIDYSGYQENAAYGYNPAYPVPELGRQPQIMPGGEDQELEEEVQDQLEEIRDPLRTYVEGGLAFRNVDGEAGLSQFDLVAIPLSGGAHIGPGMLTLQVAPTEAFSGTLDNGNAGVWRRFGTNATLPGNFTNSPAYDGVAKGVAAVASYALPNLAVDFGTTPAGFLVENMIGHVVWRLPINNEVSIKLTGLREGVLDSFTSYAGSRDPERGLVWGGVTRNGGRFDIGYDNGRVGVYADATFAYYDGQHVATNYMVDAGGGAYWRFFHNDWGGLKVGLNLSGQTYERNEDFFTYGWGGYWSPQAAVEATIPVEWSGRWDRLTYSVGGQVGVLDFHQNSEPYFPLDPTLQAAAIGNTGGAAIYPSQSVISGLYGVTAKAEYELMPLVVVGASFSADNSYNYNEQSVLFYLKKKFDTF